MSEIADIPPERLIRSEGFSCPCGKEHRAAIQYLKIQPGAVRLVPEALAVLGARRPMVVCGPFGYEAAGKAVCALLEEAGVPFTLYRLHSEDGGRIRPAEYAAGGLLLNFDPGCDLVLGVGSGVINDLCKVLGRTAGIPCMIVATAPSMDGYASDSASVEIDGIKRSIRAQMPAAILCDTEIMTQAPIRMIHAGLGDIFAKYTSLFDWRLAHMITGEYYCGEVAELVDGSLQKTVAAAHRAVSREEDAVRAIAEGLVLSGIGMAFAGSSHPASGLDHYFSHCWEMLLLERGRDYELHGLQTGVGMLLTLKIAEKLKTIHPDLARAQAAADRFDPVAWEQNLRRVFPKAADGILEIERKAGKNERAGRLKRAARIIAAWDEIVRLMEETLPRYDEVKTLMLEAGMPTTPQELGLTVDDAADAFVCSRDIRDKYLFSSMIWDIGYMEEAAEWVREAALAV